MGFQDRRAVVLKNIAAPSLRCGIPPKALMRVMKGGAPFILLQPKVLGVLIAVGLYVYYFRKTQENPFFIEEAEARKVHRKTRNIHSVKGNYYSA